MSDLGLLQLLARNKKEAPNPASVNGQELAKEFLDNVVNYSKDLVSKEVGSIMSPPPDAVKTKSKNSPEWVEIITFCTGESNKPYSNTKSTFTYQVKLLLNVLCNERELCYTDMDMCDPNKTVPGASIEFNEGFINFITTEEALLVYDKLKEMMIGKGNNYIQINCGKVKALTIPTSKKKEALDNGNKSTKEERTKDSTEAKEGQQNTDSTN